MMKKFILVYFAAAIVLTLSASGAVADNHEGGYAEKDACMDCHEEQYASLEGTTHGNEKHPKSPAAGKGCQSCHGPMAAHVEAGGEEAPPVEAAACLECHSKGKTALWSGSTHEQKGLACRDCHNPHGGNKKLLAAATQPETCDRCHKKIRADLLKTSHHPIREGKIDCSDCHNPHGTVTESLLSSDSLPQKCYECHAEKRGPYLWEHAPVTEDCTTCHTPHGSVHDKLLRARLPYLCQRCHSNSRHPGTLYAQSAEERAAGLTVYQSESSRVYYKGCVDCHAQIHGSNHPSGKSLAR